MTGKVCGAWNRVPRRYRRQLRKDQLIAQITSAEGRVVDGGVAKHYGLTTEMFSGLLLPEGEEGETSNQLLNSGTPRTHKCIAPKSFNSIRESWKMEVENQQMSRV